MRPRPARPSLALMVGLFVLANALSGCFGDSTGSGGPTSSATGASHPTSPSGGQGSSPSLEGNTTDPPGVGYEGNSTTFTPDPPEDVAINVTKNWTSATLTTELVKDAGETCAIVVAEPAADEPSGTEPVNATWTSPSGRQYVMHFTSPIVDCTTPGGTVLPGATRTVVAETRTQGDWLVEFAGLGHGLHIHLKIANP